MGKSSFWAVVAVLVGLVAAVATSLPASAAPAGAAQNLVFGSQVCQADGTVSGTFQWSPSGAGSQYVDLALDSGFVTSSRGGPYASNASAVTFTNLTQGGTYSTRVLTVTSSGTLASDTLTFVVSCTPGSGGAGPITAPTNLVALPVQNGVNLAWSPGSNNSWFCVDIANNLTDLLNLTNSWRNYGCWTTSTNLTVTGLTCSTNYYWLVYAWNGSGNVKSQPSAFQTSNCAPNLTPPVNLYSQTTSDGGVLFGWTGGIGNVTYCLDTAQSASDLVNRTGSFIESGCQTTSTQYTLYNLSCGEAIYWRVYAWNGTASTYSATATAQTPDCGPESATAAISSVDVVKDGSDYYAKITIIDGCPAYTTTSVERNGNRIDITLTGQYNTGHCACPGYGYHDGSYHDGYQGGGYHDGYMGNGYMGNGYHDGYMGNYDCNGYSGYPGHQYVLSVDLGSDFVHGHSYQVVVNHQVSTTFVAD